MFSRERGEGGREGDGDKNRERQREAEKDRDSNRDKRETKKKFLKHNATLVPLPLSTIISFS